MVSVITPSFNSKDYIARSIESVLSQEYEHWEMIIVDDFSTDNSWDIIEEYRAKDERIKSFKLDRNSGAAVARNKGIELASGRYIAFLDSDDQWHPEKLKKQIKFMQMNDYAFTFTGYIKINELGEHIKSVYPPSKVSFKDALNKNPIGCLTAMYDSEQIGKQYMPLIRKRQDYGLWLRILKIVDGYGLEAPLAFYRVRSGSISSNKLKLIKYQWLLYRKIMKLPLLQSFYYTLTSIINKIVKS